MKGLSVLFTLALFVGAHWLATRLQQAGGLRVEQKLPARGTPAAVYAGTDGADGEFPRAELRAATRFVCKLSPREQRQEFDPRPSTEGALDRLE